MPTLNDEQVKKLMDDFTVISHRAQIRENALNDVLRAHEHGFDRDRLADIARAGVKAAASVSA